MTTNLEPPTDGWAAADTSDDLVAALISSEAMVANLQIALATNRTIGIAMGILMHARRITEEAAFELLRAASQNAGRKLALIAGEVVETGTLEDPPATLTIVR